MFIPAQKEYDIPDVYIQKAIDGDLSDIDSHYVNAPRSAYFCAIDSNTDQLLGMVGVRPLSVGSETYYKEVIATVYPSDKVPFDPRNTAELNRMVVQPAARRRGIARALIERCAQFCREQGYGHLHLSTMATPPIVPFYLSCGFQRYRNDRFFVKASEAMREHIANGGTEEDATRKFIPNDEVPSDLAEIVKLRERGIVHVTSMILPTGTDTGATV